MTALETHRTYGGWRRSRSLGLGRLDTRQTAVVVLSALAPLIALAAGAMLPALLLAVLGAGAAVLVVAQRDGQVLLDAVTGWARWQIADVRGQTSFRGQFLAPLPRAWDLPGALAQTTLVDAEHPGRGRAGIVWHRRTGVLAAALLLSPGGALLADRAVVERQVAGWGLLLAGLGDDPAISAAALTVELSPDPGTRLHDHVTGRLHPGAPPLARQVMREIVAAAPYASAQVATRLTLALRPERAATRPQGLPDAVAEVLRTLDALPIAAAGADVLRVATPEDLAAIVRRAFDPDSAAAPRAAHDQLLWGEAGPVTAEDLPDYYQHDGAYSQSFVLVEAPRQQVPHDLLLPLLSPGRYLRRVTLHYRTLSRAEAGAVLERETNAAAAREQYRVRTRRDATARDLADTARAHNAAAEEAHGAGLVLFTLAVTVTAPDLASLADARAEVEKAAGRARLRLRPARHAQAAAFAASLPVGLHPADL